MRTSLFKLGSLLLWLLATSSHCWAHGLSGSGLLHPLTGLDHLLAMLAVGAWSAQIGGRFIYIVPGCFASLMVVGGLLGRHHQPSSCLEGVVACSVLLLGLAISIDKQWSWLVASLGVGLFGFSHGWSHGQEMSQTVGVTEYVIGFLITTLSLHLIGALGGLLLLEETKGRLYLRLVGVATTGIGLYLWIQ